MDKAAIRTTLKRLTKRDADSHKHQFGHVAVIGGSPGMEGAALLACSGALRSGAGLVTLLTSTERSSISRPPEVMSHAITSSDTAAQVDAVLQFCAERKVNVVVLGPGMSADSHELARAITAALMIPIILDAGALTAFQNHLPELAAIGTRNPDIILTPHPGEYATLTDMPLTDFARQQHITILLKGHYTEVASGQQHFTNQAGGNPGMATAGSGDVLSGVVAGLRGQIDDSFVATSAGVYLHSLAGNLAAQAKSQPGMLASDIIEYLPMAWISLLRGE